ncbi:S53 family peptidase [Ktedonobacteria bacterium brp13]|nr:S53 family peptidase [Ktedonobacteria bacterium brp13]
MQSSTRRLLYVALSATGILAITLGILLGSGMLRASTRVGATAPVKRIATAQNLASGGMPASTSSPLKMPPGSSQPDAAAPGAPGGMPASGNSGVTPMRPQWGEAVKMNNGNLTLKCLNSNVAPRCYSPQQIRQAYGVTPLLQAGITGKGRIITLIEAFQDPTIASELALFDQTFGLNNPQLNILTPFGKTPFDPKDAAQTAFAGETALDVEWAHAMAPDATIDVVEGNVKDETNPGQLTALLQATNFAVQSNLGSVISQSFGVSEQCLSSTFIQQAHQIYEQARAQKQTVFASAGDNGAAAIQCNTATGMAASIVQGIEYPASDPLVTSVGGTSLQAAADGTYQSEVTWNTSQQNAGATGGGYSVVFARPPFQQHVVLGNARGIADIAFNANPLTGVPVVTSSLKPGQTLLIPIGGTSLGVPAIAGITALFDQAAGNTRLGFINSALYRIQQHPDIYAATFHDITQGNNSFFFQVAKGQNIMSAEIAGFNAQPGWDPPTGLGTFIADAMARVLPEYIHANDGSTL